MEYFKELVRLSLLLHLLLISCSGNGSSSNDAGTDGDADGDTDTETDGDTDGDSDQDGGIGEITVDIYQNMESGDDGDLLTPEIMNTSSFGGCEDDQWTNYKC